MLRSSESETEILLSNAQILGIFFVLAILLGIAFTGGYMVGRGSVERKAAATTANPAAGGTTAAETHAVSPDASTDDGSRSASTAPLGTEHARNQAPTPPADVSNGFRPDSGQTFLQVAAVSRDEAVAIADVLHKKGFRAHAVPKPGSAKLYRVLIGPIRDTADLSSTRESLRKTGFREVITQKY